MQSLNTKLHFSKRITMSISIKTGAPVTGEDFFGRKRELRNAHRYLEAHQSLLLSAPRRIGKSSLAKKLKEELTEKGWKCLYIDLQGIATMEAFLRTLLSALNDEKVLSRGNVRAFFEDVFGKVDGISLGKIKIDIKDRDITESLFRRLATLLDRTQDTLIIIDELPLFLGNLMDRNFENRDTVETMLSWFRNLRQEENSAIRWVFCGSVGLRNFTNYHNLSHTINDLTDLEVGALPQDEAKGLLKALADAYNLRMDKTLIDQTLVMLQWPIPYFIQLLIDRLLINIENPAEYTVTEEDVRKAIDELSHSDRFMTWDERLKEYRNLEPIARAVLDSLAGNDSGIKKENLFTIAMEGHEATDAPKIKSDLTKVLEMLIHDGYIIREDHYRKFRSPLLRKWWKYKFID